MPAQRKNLAVAACAGLVLLKQSAFVQPPKAARAPAAAALGGSAALLSSQAALASVVPHEIVRPKDPIDVAAKALTENSYAFLKDIDWNSLLFAAKPGGSGSAIEWLKAIDTALVMGNAMDPTLLRKGVEAHITAIKNVNAAGVPEKGDYTAMLSAIGHMVASVPEAKTMAVYDSFSKLVGKDVPPYLMSTVRADDAKVAYWGLMKFKDVVKANPISHPEVSSALVSDKMKDAASKLSSASYPFLKEVDWTSDLYSKPLPGVGAKQALSAVDAALKMGVAMDPSALHGAVEAHHKAIGGVDAKGVPTLGDYAAINAAIGTLIASVPASKTMDVYNAFAKIVSPDVGKFNMATVVPDDAKAAYSAFLEFKDVVKASQI